MDAAEQAINKRPSNNPDAVKVAAVKNPKALSAVKSTSNGSNVK